MNLKLSKTNLLLLENKFPVLANKIRKLNSGGFYNIQPSKTDFPGVIFKKPEGAQITIHSCYDPKKEAQKFIKSHLKELCLNFMIFGFGLGYHIQELIKKISIKSKIFIIEKDPELLWLAIENNDLKDILNHPGVHLSVGEDPEAISIIAEELKYDFAINNFKLLKYSSLYDNNLNYYQKYENNFEQIIQKTKIDINTQEAFSKKFFINEFANLEFTLNSNGINKFKNFSDGQPGVIISAGPSLDKNIALLKNAKSKALLISVPTALNLLIKNRITPDFVVAIDPNEISINSFDFETIPSSVTLLYNPTIPKIILERFPGKKIVFDSLTFFNQWLVNKMGSKGNVGIKQSVGHIAASIGKYFGCNPIILVGQDLAFDGTRLHCSESQYIEAYKMGCTQTRNTDYFIQQRFKDNLTNMKPALDIFGNLSTTTLALDSFKNIFTKDIVKNSNLFNATEGGIPIPQIPNVSLKEILFNHSEIKVEFEVFDSEDITLMDEKIKKVEMALKSDLDSYSCLLELINKIIFINDNQPFNEQKKIRLSQEIQNLWNYLENKPELFLFLQNFLVENFLEWNRKSHKIILAENSKSKKVTREMIFKRDLEFIKTFHKEVQFLVKIYKEKLAQLSAATPVEV